MAKPIRQQLEEVYWEHRQGLFTLALSITRCHSRAEDAVHEAFMRLWKSHLAPRRVLVPYVFAAVRNAAIDQVRRVPVTQDVQQTSIYNGQMDDPLASAIDAERQEMMRKAVEDLPDEQRQAVVLHVYADMTFEQVAEMLGEPLPTIASRYRRALERLKQVAGRFV
jgi:RNA polymerase sigma-70 factor, ECF subfamily